ncbi:hypothetical protein [Metabacillus fastidiosus]|uniref:hypothetical protein n=1 Tax=Metabacillus fastidiosus TaxID=1458 RepID=UPI002E1FD86C|nr:hypothetical protein [Metabacillus fastidiosus]
MKFQHLLSLFIFITLFIFLLYPVQSSAKWAYSFVVWDGYTYIISDEYVTEVDKEIGHVTKYSDIEGTYSGNFSNSYKEGTKYYSIKGISTAEAITIQEGNNKYRKAVRDGKYSEAQADYFQLAPSMLMIMLLVTAPIIVFSIYLIEKKVSK